MFQRLLYLLCLTLLGSGLFAQQSRLLHENHSLDSIQEIHLALKGDLDIDTWPGNTILVETHLEVYDISRAVFDHYIKHGRYELEASQDQKVLKLAHKDELNQEIRNRQGAYYEQLSIRILVPEDFVASGPNQLRRRKPDVATASGEAN